MSQENVEVVRDIYAAWAKGDFRGRLDLYDENIVYTTFTAEGDAITVHGLDAMVQWHRQFFSQWRNFRLEAHEVIDCGGNVLVIGHQFAEGKSSGTSVEMPVFGVWTFRDGRVVEFISTRHRDVALEAAGLRE